LIVKEFPAFARTPPEIVREETVNRDAAETLPEITRVANACETPIETVDTAPVSVTVEVPAITEEDAPDVSQEPDTETNPVVSEIEFAEASFIVTPATEMDAVVPMRAPPPETVRFAPPVMLLPDVVSAPRTESVPLTSIAVPCVTVPEMVKSWNPLLASRILTVFVGPESVTTLVPRVKVDPAPEVSQLPATVHPPLVKTIVPEVPPFIVTSTTETVDAPALKIPELPTATEPPRKDRSAVVTVVVEPAVSWIVRVWLHRRAFVAIVNVTAPVLAVDWKVTS
jgi:hypothetical protein